MNKAPARLRLTALAAMTLIAPSAASAEQGGVSISAPAASKTAPAAGKPTVPGAVGKILQDGTAAAPELAPDAVRNAIWAANKIVGKPYRYGGGHARFNDTAYDCSGTISYALKGAKALKAPLDSGSFMTWGVEGPGQWITVYTRADHAYLTIAGLRLDTSAAGDPGGKKGPRWRPLLPSDSGYTARRPDGL